MLHETSVNVCFSVENWLKWALDLHHNQKQHLSKNINAGNIETEQSAEQYVKVQH